MGYDRQIFCVATLWALLIWNGSSAHGVDWRVGSGKPEYILGFVGVPNGTGPGQWNLNAGGDVDHPDPDRKNLFLALIPGRRDVAHIFPRLSHVAAGLISSLDGAVVEPSASDDGTKFFITYYHDISQKNSATRSLTAGADGYEVDMSACKRNPQCNLDTDIRVRRLTFQDPDKFKHAMNPLLAERTIQPFGNVVNRDFLEIEDDFGKAIVFVSTRRQVYKSNHTMFRGGQQNQFSLFMGRQDASGKLINIKQIHYLTTTSAMSPSRASDGGFYFSYQANTEQRRTWTIWHSDMSQKWSPVFGIGHHLATHHFTECRTSNHRQGNVGLGIIYYPANNNGTGGILGIPIEERGTDKLHTGYMSGTMVPRNEGEYTLTPDAGWDKDDAALPGGNCEHGSAGCVPHSERWGKAATLRCGERDTLYFSWTKGGYSNHRLAHGYESPVAPYPARIVKTRDVVTPQSVSNTSHFEDVVYDAATEMGAWWATPLLSFEQRFGRLPRTDSASGTKLGQPTAIFGTSKLSNTENLPWLCYSYHRRNGQWDPHKLGTQEAATLFSNIAGVNWVRDFEKLDEICGSATQAPKPLLDDNIGAIEIRLTSNLTDTETAAGGQNNTPASRKEQVKVLGNIQPEQDGSFWTHIPSNAPFDLILRHKETGMKLLDRTSWASLKPGQVSTDCGGCHNHQKNAGVPFAGTMASRPEYTPTDILTKTKTMEYDTECNPTYVEQNVPSVLPPAFEDVLPGLNQYCGSCHSAGTPTGSNTWYVNVNNPEETVHQLTSQRRNGRTIKYLNEQTGALGSPAFWYARGRGRLDGVPNQPGYQIDEFQYDVAHEGYLDLCSSRDPAKAKWVRDFGVMIDEGIQKKYQYQVQRPIPMEYELDRFHPSVAVALPDPARCQLGDRVTVGAWDDGGLLRLITVKRNDELITTLENVSNGQYSIQGVELSSNTDVVEVMAMDRWGNRQLYKLTGDELLDQCLNGGDHTLRAGGIGRNGRDISIGEPLPGGPDDIYDPKKELERTRAALQAAIQELRSERNKRERVRRKLSGIRQEYGSLIKEISDGHVKRKFRRLKRRRQRLTASIRELRYKVIPNLSHIITLLERGSEG